MRQTYRVELDEVMVDLAWLARRVISCCSQVTTVLCPGLDHRCVRLLALQAPVATELRLVVAAMDAVGHLLRMSKLAGHIAKITRMKQQWSVAS